MLTLPIDALEIGDAIARCFRRNGVTTIGDFVSKRDDQLLKLRGIGILKVETARSALERIYGCDPQSLIDATKSHIADSIKSQAYDKYVNSYDIRTGRNLNLFQRASNLEKELTWISRHS